MKEEQQIKKLKVDNKITRIEVIENGKGRVYTNYDVKTMELSLQDNERTLKIFVNYTEDV